MLYRLYLLDERGQIRAAENFSAESDDGAMEIAARVHNACDDAFPQYELWCGSDQILRVRGSAHTGQRRVRIAQDITSTAEEIVLDLEDQLQRSFTIMADSKKLLEATAEQRRRLYPYADTS
jgi:hypothetical protein